MNLKTKFIVLIVLIHGLLIALSWPLFAEHRLYFFLVEIGIALSMWYSLRLARQFFEPLQLIAEGTRAIREQDFQVKFMPSPQPEINQLISVYNTMMDKLREERAAKKEQHYFLDKLIRASPAGLVVLDYDQRIVSLNPAAERLLGQTSAMLYQQPIAQLPHLVFQRVAALHTGEATTVEVSGTQRYKCHLASFVHQGFEQFFLLIEDVSHEIMASERKAFSKVIRMMSHEINNSMGAVNSLLDTLKHYAPPEGEDRDDYLQALEVIIHRNKHLNRFMNNFSDVVRLPQPHKEPTEVQKMLRDVHQLMAARCKAMGVRLQLEVPEKVVRIALDAEQMEQVLINAVKNASEAIRDSQIGDSITLLLDPTEARLVVRDNGPGIPDEVAQKIFSPFFSTKKDGQGIGLMISREILMNHQFGFSLRTKAAGCTEFEVLLPAHELSAG